MTDLQHINSYVSVILCLFKDIFIGFTNSIQNSIGYISIYEYVAYSMNIMDCIPIMCPSITANFLNTITMWNTSILHKKFYILASLCEITKITEIAKILNIIIKQN